MKVKLVVSVTRRLVACLFLLLAGVIQVSGQSWDLVWNDEFDYVGLPNPNLWDYDVGGHGWGNQELQYYTEDRTENARVDGDHLIIEARFEGTFGGRQYTSARLVSRGKGDWTYGRIAVRAKLPKGRGTWPAIWMLPSERHYGNGGWPDNGEIDIMEHVGYQPNVVHSTVHNNRHNHLSSSGRGGSRTVPDATDAFHVYMVEWSPRKLDFYIDDVKTFTYYNDTFGWSSWPYDKPFHLLMNIAIGGSWGGLQGVDDSIFPTQLVVDYVRVYQYTALPQVTLTAPDRLTQGESLNLVATASDPDGSVYRVDFFQGGGVLEIDTNAPFETSVDNVQNGCYSLYATVVDNNGWPTTTGPHDLQVGDTCGKAPYLIAPHSIPGIIEAEYYDLGGPNVSYLDLSAQNVAGALRPDEGVDIDYSNDRDGYDLAGIARREWVEYTVDVKQAGEYRLDARVHVPGTQMAFTLEFDGMDKTGVIRYRNPASVWVTPRHGGIHLTEGIQTMRMKMESAGFRVNWLQFTLVSGTSTESEEVPEPAALHASYPNPFTHNTRLTYTIGKAGHVNLEVLDILGRQVAVLADHHHMPGEYEVQFIGEQLAPGVYWSRLTTGRHVMVQPLTLIRP